MALVINEDNGRAVVALRNAAPALLARLLLLEDVAEAARVILDCPHGLESRNPVIVNMSIALEKIERLMAALARADAKEEPDAAV